MSETHYIDTTTTPMLSEVRKWTEKTAVSTSNKNSSEDVNRFTKLMLNSFRSQLAFSPSGSMLDYDKIMMDDRVALLASAFHCDWLGDKLRDIHVALTILIEAMEKEKNPSSPENIINTIPSVEEALAEAKKVIGYKSVVETR